VAARLEPAAAARTCAAAARLLARALEKETDARTLNTLVEGLAAVAAQMEPDVAEQVCAGGIKRLLRAWTQTTNPEQLASLEGLVATLLNFLSPDTAGPLAKRLAARVCAACDDASTSSGALELLLKDTSPPSRRSRAAAVAALVSQAPAGPLPSLPALAAAGEPRPCRLSTQDLVELVKMPTGFAWERRVVLRHLSNRYGRPFTNHWDFVRFAQEHRLGLDLTSPPPRPRPEADFGPPGLRFPAMIGD
jgi:hypothetical protein